MDATTNTILQDAALSYAAIGLHILPAWWVRADKTCACGKADCKSPGKHPIGKLAPKGQDNATTDPAVIAAWWDRYPHANIAAFLQPSNLCAVDIDPRNDGHITIADLEAKHGPVASDLLQFTGGGGEHRVFKAPGGTLPGALGKGIDLKANGYIMLEPSNHLSGGSYAWEASSDPRDGIEASPLPAWICALGKATAAPATMATNCAATVIDVATVRDLRSALNHLPADDRDQWVDIGLALKELGDVGRGLWLDWSQKSDEFQPSDARTWDTFKPVRTGYAAVFARAQAAGWVNPAKGIGSAMEPVEAWPQPTPLPDGLPPVQAFDAELLPEALRCWVTDIAERMQCPPDFTAVGAMVALSSVIGARAVARPKAKDDWTVVPNLWGAIIGRPGVMKSPALSEVLKPLHRLEKNERELWQAAHDAWQLDCKVASMADDAKEKSAKGLAAKDPVAARALLVPTDTPAEPTMRRYVVNDATVEKLADLLVTNQWGTLVYRDEMHGLLCSMDKQGQEGARGFYLTGYDGNQGHAVDRILRGESYVPRVCLAMLGGIQPGKVQSYVREAVAGGAGDDGLLQRFGLTVWPDVKREFVYVDRWPDTLARQTAWAVFERLNQLQPTDAGHPVEWCFSTDAQAIFEEWMVSFENEIRGEELHPALVSHLSKYRKLIPALALIFALVDTPDSASVIHENELIRALAWGDYLRSHAERLYSAAVKPETAGAVALLTKIKSGLVRDNFKIKDVQQKGWAGLATTEDVRKAAEVLEVYDWLRCDVMPAGAAGGRPSQNYRLNPCLVQE